MISEAEIDAIIAARVRSYSRLPGRHGSRLPKRPWPCVGDCGRMLASDRYFKVFDVAEHYAQGLCYRCWRHVHPKPSRHFRPFVLRPRPLFSCEVDPAAVVRACGGDTRLRLTRAETTECVRRLTQQGLSAQQVADRLGITGRQVTRHRAVDRAARQQAAA
jgi:hypothetical protein